MMQSTKYFSVLPYAAMFLLCLCNGCGSPSFDSVWRDHEIVIDGRNNEWDGKLTMLDDKVSAIGVMNDDEYLYIAFISSNQQLQREALGGGFTFWFDPDGGDKKTFGLRYPVGNGHAQSDERYDRDNTTHASHDSVNDGTRMIDILGPQPMERHRQTVAETKGIDIQYGVEEDVMTCELKIPLRDTSKHPFVIGVKPGASVGFSIEPVSPMRPRPNRDSSGLAGSYPGQGGWGSTGSGPGGGGGGMGGGMGHRGGGGGGRGRSRSSSSQPEQFKLQSTIHLAEMKSVK